MQRPEINTKKQFSPKEPLLFGKTPVPFCCHRNQLALQSAQLCRRRQRRDCVGRLATAVNLRFQGRFRVGRLKSYRVMVM